MIDGRTTGTVSEEAPVFAPAAPAGSRAGAAGPAEHRDRPELVLEPVGRWPGLNARELWVYRELFFFMVWRDLKIRYQQTVLGVAWAIVQPLVSTLLFTIIFGRLAKVPSDGVPYPIFALAAMIPWTFFSASYANASMSLIGNASMISKIYFPRLIIPLTPVLVGLVDFAVAAVLLALGLLIYGIAPSPIAIVLVPYLLIVLVIATAGVGTLLSAVNLEFRDVKHVVPFLTQLWMYASPVVYPLSMIPERWQLLYAVNPMAGIIEGLRAALFGLPVPWAAIGVSSLSAVAVFVYGILHFRRTEPRFADIA